MNRFFSSSLWNNNLELIQQKSKKKFNQIKRLKWMTRYFSIILLRANRQSTMFVVGFFFLSSVSSMVDNDQMLNKITYYWFSIFNENFRCRLIILDRYRNSRSNHNQQFKLRFIVNIKFDFPPNSCVTWSFWQLFTISNSNLRARGQMIAWNEYECCMDSSRNRMAEEINDSVKLVVKENTLKAIRINSINYDNTLFNTEIGIFLCIILMTDILEQTDKKEIV